MKQILLTFFLSTVVLGVKAQTANQIINLETPVFDESSGVIFYNDKLITHNDSGGKAKLYEVNVATGLLERTILITNATNVDWEDITQDDLYIYLGDIGNNSGSRTDLKIYKILKEDYDSADNTALAEIILYSYADQTDFTPNVNNNNWDAEGLIAYGDNLLIFSKNWLDNTVNVYSITKAVGEAQSAIFESTYNTNGLVTGADSSADGTVIFITGYSGTAAPFMFSIFNIPDSSLDIFSGTVSEKISNIAPLGNQIEGIALFEITETKHRLYLTNEKYVLSVGPINITFPAKLWLIEIDNETITLNIPSEETESNFNLYPNPFDKILNLSKRVDEIIIYDLSGRPITEQHFVNQLSLENLSTGIYIAHLKINHANFIRKIIKK